MAERIRVSMPEKPKRGLGDLLRRPSTGGGADRRGHKRPGPQRTSVPLVRFRHMMWIVVLVAGFIAAKVYGTPHLLTTYSYYGPREWPIASTCNYWGLDSQTIDIDGACPLFRLLKAKGARHG